jgi:small subunit ribosomal protein S7
MSELKLFNKWDIDDITVSDLGLRNYITIEPRVIPKTGARYAGNRFHKSKITIVERLANKLMIPGHKARKHFKSSGRCTGKSTQVLKLIEETFNIIEERLSMNPLAVFVKAIENAAPREEVITIEYGGARYPKAVECAPQRRIDLVLRYMVQSSYQKSFGSKKSAADCLADEITNAYRCTSSSAAVSKKLDLERQADSSR